MEAVFKQEGKIIGFASATALAAGEIVVKGSLIGCIVRELTAADIVAGRGAELQLEGVFTCAKEASLVVTQGDELYFDESENVLTKTSSGNIFFGIATLDSATAATTVYARLVSSPSLIGS